MNKVKQKFLMSQVVMMTLAATLQRNRIYKKHHADEKRRSEIRRCIENELKRLSQVYDLGKVAEDEHIKNIKSLAATVSNKYKKNLFEERFTIGSAQKALNLFLKYLWCLEYIKEEPPHFPVDAIMLNKIKGCKGISWTKLNDIEQYSKIIKAAKDVAKGKDMSLATWELVVYTE